MMMAVQVILTRHWFTVHLVLAACAINFFLGVEAQNLSDTQLSIVQQRLAEGAVHSWELGTREEALTELNARNFSVLNGSSVPPKAASEDLQPIFEIVAAVINNNTHGSQNNTPVPLVLNDGSAADPASNGVAALLANWTGQNNASINYGLAAVNQMNYLWTVVPRTSDGALSHRVAEVQLWSDFIYMVPPFIAYYGVTTANRSMLEAAYTQISLYRNYLRDPNSNNLWKHVVFGSDFNDTGHWSTGNGWAAAGMLRVLATISGSQYSHLMKNEMKDLKNWVNEIHDGMYLNIRPDNLFNNYVDDNNTFADAASATLLAATVYRNALLAKTYRHVPTAEAVRQTIFGQNSSSSSSSSSFSSSSESSIHSESSSSTRNISSSSTATEPSSTATAPSSSSSSSSAFQNMAHFTSEGWLTPVVNPDSFGQEGQNSPEAQAFTLMLAAAHRDWVENGSPGATGGARPRSVPAGTTSVGAGLAVGAAVWVFGMV